METSKLVISRFTIRPIDKRELESFFSYLNAGCDLDNVCISVEYLKEICKLAIDGCSK